MASGNEGDGSSLIPADTKHCRACPSWARDLTVDYLCASIGLTECSKFNAVWNSTELEQSNVAVVELVPAELNGTNGSLSGKTKSHLLFVKRTNVRWLQAKMNKSTEKWAISVHSFANELNFYALVDSPSMCAFACAVPRVLATDTRVMYPEATLEQGDDRWFDRQFTTVLECLSKEEWQEYRNYDVSQTLCALSYLARFHAYHWIRPVVHAKAAIARTSSSGEQREQTLHSALFAPGAWWRAALRPSVRFDQCESVFQWLTGPQGLGGSSRSSASTPSDNSSGDDAAASNKKGLSCTSAGGCAAHLWTQQNAALVAWLCRHIDDISRAVAPTDAGLATPDTSAAATQRGYRTLVHGDFKSSNVFFRRDNPSALVSIDFQWTGRAVSGMADVVYLLLAGTAWESLAPAEAEADVRAHPWFRGSGSALSDGALAVGMPGPVLAYLEHYHTCLEQALQERGLDCGATGHTYGKEEMLIDWHLEVADYCKTALPYLLSDLTPALCEANKAKYGWLTHEYDPRSTVYLLETLLASLSVLKENLLAWRVQEHA